MSNCPDCGVQEGQYHRANCPWVEDKIYRDTTSAENSPKVMPTSISVSIPPEVTPYTNEIRRFVEAMVYKLAVHAKKGKWEEQTAESRVPFLEKEVDELKEALQRGNMVEVLLESADVANYAMILSAIVMERGR